MIRSGQEDQIRELDSGVVCITAKGRPVKPKTLGQKAYAVSYTHLEAAAFTALRARLF